MIQRASIVSEEIRSGFCHCVADRADDGEEYAAANTTAENLGDDGHRVQGSARDRRIKYVLENLAADASAADQLDE